MRQPTPTDLVLRHESTNDRKERMDIRRQIMRRMKREPGFREAFNFLERG